VAARQAEASVGFSGAAPAGAIAARGLRQAAGCAREHS